MKNTGIKKNSSLENWLEKLQQEDGEKIGIVGEKILSQKIGIKNSTWKMDKRLEQSAVIGEKIPGQKIDVKNSSQKINRKNCNSR